MISLFISLLVLVAGYIIYGRIVDGVFAPDDRKTPAVAMADGVDYVPMKTWKAFLVQLLNIAGTGPIFGALMGACFGPVVFLWIVFGSILGGAVHDYMVGMISERHEGKSIAELSGIYLGNGARWGMLSLWMATAYLLKTHANKMMSLVTALPATFMSAVSMTYILMANEGFRLGAGIGYPVGVVFAAACFTFYATRLNEQRRGVAR